MNRDDQWFERFYAAWYPRVVAFFVARGCSKDEARDLAQDVFVRVYQYRGTFRDESSEKTWLFTIIHGVWSNEIRYRRAKMRSGQRVAIDAESSLPGEMLISWQLLSQDMPADKKLEIEEALGLLRTAIKELSPRQRHVILLQNQDHSYKEIAELLAISVETVKSLRHDALKTLKRMLSGTRLRLD